MHDLPPNTGAVKRLSYEEQLRTPEWKKRSNEIKNLAKWLCEDCGRYSTDPEVTLNTHHLFYRKNTMAWEYPDEALMCCCQQCHYIREAQTEQVRETFLKLLRYVSLNKSNCIQSWVFSLQHTLNTAKDGKPLGTIQIVNERKWTRLTQIDADLTARMREYYVERLEP